jgi:hypothetical protein
VAPGHASEGEIKQVGRRKRLPQQSQETFSFRKHFNYFTVSFQLLGPSDGADPSWRQGNVELQERADRQISSLYIPYPPPESPPLLDERTFLRRPSLVTKKEYFDFLSDSR